MVQPGQALLNGQRRRRSPPRSEKRDTEDLEHDESGDVDNGPSAARRRSRGNAVLVTVEGPRSSEEHGSLSSKVHFEGCKRAKGGIERVETVDCGPEVGAPGPDTCIGYRAFGRTRFKL